MGEGKTQVFAMVDRYSPKGWSFVQTQLRPSCPEDFRARRDAKIIGSAACEADAP